MKKLNSIADLKAAAKEYKPILDLRENHTDAIPDKRDILVCGGTGCTSSESLLIIEKLKEEIKKYNLEDVITLNNYEYKVIGWGDLETRFNDDRNIEKNKNKDKER